MSNEELKNSITAILPTSTFDETGEFLTAVISSEELLPLMKELRTKSELDFDYLFCNCNRFVFQIFGWYASCLRLLSAICYRQKCQYISYQE